LIDSNTKWGKNHRQEKETVLSLNTSKCARNNALGWGNSIEDSKHRHCSRDLLKNNLQMNNHG
jgi:hypothetical protein